MTDWTAKIIATMDALPGDEPWEVIPGSFTIMTEKPGDFLAVQRAEAEHGRTGEFVNAILARIGVSIPARVCRDYTSAGAAHAALTAAGFEPTAKFVPSPPLAPHYDLQTVMRYTAGEGRDVLLVRRSGVVIPSCDDGSRTPVA